MRRLARPLGMAVLSAAFLAAGMALGAVGGLTVSSATPVPVPETLFARHTADVELTGRLVRSLPVVEGARQRACPVGEGWLDVAFSWEDWDGAVIDDFAPVPVFRAPSAWLVVEPSRVYEGSTGRMAIVLGRAGSDVSRVRALFDGSAADEMVPVQGWFALAGPWTSGPATVWALGAGGEPVGSVDVPDSAPPGTPMDCLGAGP